MRLAILRNLLDVGRLPLHTIGDDGEGDLQILLGRAFGGTHIDGKLPALDLTGQGCVFTAKGGVVAVNHVNRQALLAGRFCRSRNSTSPSPCSARSQR